MNLLFVWTTVPEVRHKRLQDPTGHSKQDMLMDGGFDLYDLTTAIYSLY